MSKYKLSNETIQEIKNYYDKLEIFYKYSNKLPLELPSRNIFKSCFISEYFSLYTYCMKIKNDYIEEKWFFQGEVLPDHYVDLSYMFYEALARYGCSTVEELLDAIDRIKSSLVQKNQYDEKFIKDILEVIDPIINIIEKENAQQFMP